VIKIAITNIDYIKIENCIVDQIEIREQTSDIDLTSTKGTSWEIDTVLLAEFLGNLEAGNVNNEGLVITKFRIKRRNSGELTNITLGEFDYDYLNPQTLEFIDKSLGIGDYIYSIVPVGENGLEGKPTEISLIDFSFTGVWLVDKNDNFTFGFTKQWDGELRTLDISLEQGRIEIETLYPYNSVFYTPKQFSRFTISALVTPSNYSITEWTNLVNKISEHVPLIVKSGSGDLYICDIYSPQKSTWLVNAYKSVDPVIITIQCMELMDYKTYMES
jgi:hypothetical protein